MRFMYARIASHSMFIFIVLYCCLMLLKLLLLILFCWWSCFFATMQHTHIDECVCMCAVYVFAFHPLAFRLRLCAKYHFGYR